MHAFMNRLQHTTKVVPVDAFAKGGQFSTVSQGYGNPVERNLIKDPLSYK